MRVLDTVFRTGGGGDTKSNTEDPEVTAERARREAAAIGIAESRRSARYGQSSTILTRGGYGSTALTRPTDTITTADPLSTPAGKKISDLEKMKASSASSSYGTRGRTSTGLLKAAIKKQEKSISAADMAAFDAAVADQDIASYINRTRSRVGVTSTRG